MKESWMDGYQMKHHTQYLKSLEQVKETTYLYSGDIICVIDKSVPETIRFEPHPHAGEFVMSMFGETQIPHHQQVQRVVVTVIDIMSHERHRVFKDELVDWCKPFAIEKSSDSESENE